MVKRNKGKAALEKWEPGMLVLANGYAAILIKSKQFKEKPGWECEYLGYPQKTVYPCFTTNLMALHANDEVAKIQKEEPHHSRGIAKAKEMIEARGDGPWSCTPGRNPTPTLLKKNGVRRNLQQNGGNGSGRVSDSDDENDDEDLAGNSSSDNNVNGDNQGSQIADIVGNGVTPTVEKKERPVGEIDAGSGCSSNGGSGEKKDEINGGSHLHVDIGRGDSPTETTDVRRNGELGSEGDASKTEEKKKEKERNDSASHHGVGPTSEKNIRPNGETAVEDEVSKNGEQGKSKEELKEVSRQIADHIGPINKNGGEEREMEGTASEKSNAARQLNRIANEAIEHASHERATNERRRRHAGNEVDEPEAQRRRIDGEEQGFWSRLVSPLRRFWPF